MFQRLCIHPKYEVNITLENPLNCPQSTCLSIYILQYVYTLQTVHITHKTLYKFTFNYIKKRKCRMRGWKSIQEYAVKMKKLFLFSPHHFQAITFTSNVILTPELHQGLSKSRRLHTRMTLSTKWCTLWDTGSEADKHQCLTFIKWHGVQNYQ
jgi:hypothetical protein